MDLIKLTFKAYGNYFIDITWNTTIIFRLQNHTNVNIKQQKCLNKIKTIVWFSSTSYF